MSNAPAPLLDVKLSVDYPNREGAVSDVAFSLNTGEMLALAGASGSGKSTVAMAILGLIGLRGGRARGSIVFEGRELLKLGERALRDLRGRRIALVPQSPVAALNPALRLETQLREAWRAHSKTEWKQARLGVMELFMQLGLPASDEFLRRYPAQISVGQAQRVVLAMAVMHKPALIIADEPTSALDAAARLETIELLRTLNREHGVALLLISHDEASIEALCPRTCRLDEGRLVA